MIPDGIRNRFELYRKWYKTLLVTEFINLPLKYQERFLAMTETFAKDCRKVLEESRNIREKTVVIKVERVEANCREGKFIVYGRADKVKDEIKIVLPSEEGDTFFPKPKIGSKICHTMYNLDGDVWYSSKEELISKIHRTEDPGPEKELS